MGRARALAAWSAVAVTVYVGFQAAAGTNQSEQAPAITSTPEAPSSSSSSVSSDPSPSEPKGRDYTQSDLTTGFVKWIVHAPVTEVGGAPSDKERAAYAKVQANASPDLVEYEKANRRYVSQEGLVLALYRCRLRDMSWASSVKDKVQAIANADPAIAETKSNIIPLEGDTAAMFGTYELQKNADWLIGSDARKGCAELATMPFLMALDAFERGEAATLPSLQ